MTSFNETRRASKRRGELQKDESFNETGQALESNPSPASSLHKEKKNSLQKPTNNQRINEFASREVTGSHGQRIAMSEEQESEKKRDDPTKPGDREQRSVNSARRST